MSQNIHQLTTSINKFDPKNYLSLEQSEDQKNVYLKYKGLPLMLQSLTFFDYHGIPKIGPYYSKDSDRGFIKLPFNQKLSESEKPDYINDDVWKKLCSSVVITNEKMSEFNTVLNSKESREMILTPYIKKGDKDKAMAKWTYLPTIREPKTEDDEIQKPAFWKAKFQTNYPEVEVIKTQLYKVTKSDDEKKKELIETNSVGDFEKNIRFRSILRFILSPARVWIKEADKQYGVTWKIIKLEYEPPPMKASGINIREYYEQDAFIDSDEEDVGPSFDMKSEVTKKNINNSVSDSDSDEYEYENSDSPDESPPKSKKGSGKKATK